MKKVVLLIVAILGNSLLFAQKTDKIWDQMDTDSASFYEQYGSPKDFNIQEDLRIQSGKNTGYPVVLIGMTFYWFNQLSLYMQKIGYNTDDFNGGDGKLYLSFVENGAINRELSKFKATIYMSPEGRMTKIIITGDFDPLAKLFTGYWNWANVSFNQIKSKGVITQNFLSDKIVWSWRGAKPTITITPVS